MHGGVLAISDVASTTQQITFWLLAVVSVAAALGMILVRKAVYCAVLLAVVMLSLAVLYALQNAPFLAFVQVIVYTGAVLMLFLFVLMIVGIRARDSRDRRAVVRREQRVRDRPADLHHLRVPVRGDQRLADHRRARGHGARAP